MPDKAEPLLRVAYLAPEIPALSATFVYNEILELGKQGIYVKPFSVHRPAHIAEEASLTELKKDIFHLYERSKWQVFLDSLFMFGLHPGRYLKSVRRLFGDVYQLGLFSRSALGLCYRFFFAATLARQLRQNRIQHVHVHFAHIPTDIAMYAAPMAGIGFSVQAHANDLFERGWLLKQKVARSAFFATISEFNKRFLEQRQADADKINIIRCGVDQSWQAPARTMAENGPFTIGTVGRLVEKKGVDTLIDAVAHLKKAGHQVRLDIAGDGPLKSALLQQCQKHKLTDQDVNFVGALPHDDVADFISRLDIFVLACKQDENGDMDGIPVVLMEAMLCGVPVISTELSGIPELVITGESGLLVKPDDDKALASAILQLEGDSNLSQRLIAGGKQRVAFEFLLETNVQRLIQLFTAHIAKK